MCSEGADYGTGVCAACHLQIAWLVLAYGAHKQLNTKKRRSEPMPVRLSRRKSYCRGVRRFAFQLVPEAIRWDACAA
ncbi:MAG: hypothetical protein EB015_14530 [Methylocystaceae bacterium]|nr:hypothetical protein [Methylocystaceae bacterium]